jgi:hypothetical protein
MTRPLVFLFAAALSCALGQAQTATVPNEKGVWALWSLQTNSPNDDAALIGACAEFRKSAPSDPFVPVADGLSAWHLLRSGRTDEAVPLLVPLASRQGSSIDRAASRMAKTWLTRLDREAVKRALKRLYVKTVAFPTSLEALKSLPADAQPPLADRWGAPWSYRLTGFRSFSGMESQKYELQSRTLGKASDLALALQLPYAAALSFKPVKVISSTPGQEVIQFESESSALAGTAAKTVVLATGSESEGMTLAYVGVYILIVTDGNHWKLMAKPGR